MELGERVIMNREILFKAKRKDWRTLPKEEWWVEGYYVYCRKRHYILPVLNKAIGFDEIEDEWIEIDPDTLCQYTGFTDKNGKKIWERDIAYIRSSGLSGYGVIKYENGNLVLVDSKRKRTYSLYGEWKIRKDGNIFDNDLLEVE